MIADTSANAFPQQTNLCLPHLGQEDRRRKQGHERYAAKSRHNFAAHLVGQNLGVVEVGSVEEKEPVQSGKDAVKKDTKGSYSDIDRNKLPVDVLAVLPQPIGGGSLIQGIKEKIILNLDDNIHPVCQALAAGTCLSDSKSTQSHWPEEEGVRVGGRHGQETLLR
eukprot:3627254-Rhodomonas_salina.1